MKKGANYIFRYPLKPQGDEGQHDPLREMIRSQLESLIKLLTLYYKGEEVKVDGFRLLNEREAVHPIFLPEEKPVQPQTKNQKKSSSWPMINNAELYEPRIPHIKRTIENLLALVSLENNGKPVKIDGLRLKDLNHWVVPSSGDPAEVFDHLATRCDCQCSFCYLQGNPPFLALQQPKRTAEEEYAEAKTRLQYFYPSKKKALFSTMGSPYDILAHPYALKVLAKLRGKIDRPLRISTNGNRLTRDCVEELSALKPVYLYLSLNSSSPKRRRQIMRGKKVEIGIHSLSLLKEKGIPYAVIIVPWPFPTREEMLADLKETIGYAQQHDVHLVEVSLPGTSRFFSKIPPFDLEEVWSEVVATIRSLREKITIPLLVKPSMYEENLYEKRKNLPRLIGVVKNSPAALAGLKTGDLILAVNGLPVSSRPQARDILRLHHQKETPAVQLSIKREKEKLTIQVQTTNFQYPYTPATDHHLGIIFLGAGFRPSAIEDLKSLIVNQGAKRVLLLSSRLVKPVLEQTLSESPLMANIQIQFLVPANNFFGGNIFMGDLLVVQDFIEAIREYLKENPPPDLIVIPSSPFALGGWQRDLTGRVYTDIERAVGLPVVLLDCEPIYD